MVSPDPYVAVCGACGWEGPEDNEELAGTSDYVCPKCHQETLNYFAPAPE
jgi:predicted RNA-binding Zn-ribbon protein involved in translation (DUF1610 family)